MAAKSSLPHKSKSAGTKRKRKTSKFADGRARPAYLTSNERPPKAPIEEIKAAVPKRNAHHDPGLVDIEERKIAGDTATAKPLIRRARGCGFEIRPNGVFYLAKNEDDTDQPLRICDALHIIAMTRNADGNEWGRLLRWDDPDGKPHQWAMPMELLQADGPEVRGELARQGLTIEPGHKAHELFTRFLSTWQVEARVRCVERLGWHGSTYVLPEQCFGEGNEQIVFQSPHAIEPAFGAKGTVDEWRQNVAALARGNSRVIFAISVALAGTLLELAGEDSGGFSFRGESSSGKTTALCAATSVWGPSEFRRQWCATTNGLEGLAALYNDCVLILDELGQMNPHDAGEAAYLLANGRGKARATRSGTARQSQTWRLLFL
jgi:putative DNA primase/helicase